MRTKLIVRGQEHTGYWAITNVAEPRGEHFYEEIQTKERAEEFVKCWNSHDDLLADRAFLLERCNRAGSCNFTDKRNTGVSSNSIVAIAFGLQMLEGQCLPSDSSDLNACRNMWEKLPEHRKTDDAKLAMKRAEAAIKAKEKRI